jgi:hypothetical protein
MAEVEYQGIKVSGGKLLLILPLLGTLGGGLLAVEVSTCLYYVTFFFLFSVESIIPLLR